MIGTMAAFAIFILSPVFLYIRSGVLVFWPGVDILIKVLSGVFLSSFLATLVMWTWGEITNRRRN